jgi:hypothetical protein
VVLIVTLSSLGSAAPVGAVGACIPSTKSAVFTYADRFMHYYEADAVTYVKLKLTAHFCRDTLGNAWGAPPLTYSIVQGAFLGRDGVFDYVRPVAGLVYARMHSGYFAVRMPGYPWELRIRVEPRLRMNAQGQYYAYDGGSAVINNQGTTETDLMPTFVSAALQ